MLNLPSDKTPHIRQTDGDELVVGHRIGDMDSERADTARVHVLIVPPSL